MNINMYMKNNKDDLREVKLHCVSFVHEIKQSWTHFTEDIQKNLLLLLTLYLTSF